jgi:hypothetical protein
MSVRREIPGNLPYLGAPGALKRVLDKTSKPNGLISLLSISSKQS